jgi:hypothetical protein
MMDSGNPDAWVSSAAGVPADVSMQTACCNDGFPLTLDRRDTLSWGRDAKSAKFARY